MPLTLATSVHDDLLRLFPRLRSMPPEAIVVGGAVRDLLLGRSPHDVDVDVSDPLAVAQSLGRKVIPLGRGDFVAWRVVEEDRLYDFALASPLGRRDFTINAIAVDLAGGELRDPFGGTKDLAARVVRMIDGRNFDDDPLRLLRAVRFAVSLGFTVDADTLDAVRRRASLISTVAPERIDYELSVIFGSGAFRRAVELLRETSLDVPLFGRTLDLEQFHADDVPPAAAYALLRHVPPGVRLAREVAALRQLISSHDRMALYDAGERVALQLPPLLRALGRDDRVDMPDFSIRALLTGDQIARLTGLPPGPELGRIKRALLEAQVRAEVRSLEEAETFVRTG